MYKSYCVHYSFFIKGEEKNNLKKDLKIKNACFSGFFSEINNYQVMHGVNKEFQTSIVIKMLKDQDLESPYSNNLIIGVSGLRKYLRLLLRYYKFNYSILEDNDKYVLLKINHFGNANEKKHLITFMRFPFEYPYNLGLCDALALYKTKEFKNIHFIDLMNITIQGYEDISGGHYLTYDSFIFKSKVDEIKNNSKKHWSINQHFSSYKKKGIYRNKLVHNNIKYTKFIDVEEIFDIDGIKSRIPVYLKSLELYKTL